MLLQASSGGMDFINIAILFGFVAVFYLFFIRPQSKRAKEQKEFLNNIKKGEKVVTTGGIHGKILKDEGASLLIEVDSNTKLRIEKSAISLDLTRSTKENTNTNKEK